MKKLVIVESPSKQKSIKKYLGPDYDVKASKGHIIDLPKKELGVDVDADYKPKYEVTKEKVLKDLKKAFKGKNTLVLAVDPDREGEAIGWHVAKALGVLNDKGGIKRGKELERIVFTEITEKAVQSAAKKPRKIDMNLVNAQQTRRILDRLVGYKLSPLLWKKIRFGLSAGRVQSVALKLIVDKERERDKFKTEEYWYIDANLVEKKQGVPKVEYIKDMEETEKRQGVYFRLMKKQGKDIKVLNENHVRKIVESTKGRKWLVEGIESKDSLRNPSAPLKTSTLQQSASTRLGFSSSRTMRSAQKLYEAGLITYMRTDSITLSESAITKARKYIESSFGLQYLSEQPRQYKTKSKVAQEAHEAIRPTNFKIKSVDIELGTEEKKLYNLIWSVTLSTQAQPAKFEIQTIDVRNGDLLFQFKGRKLLFDGFLKIDPRANVDVLAPDWKKGQEVYPTEILCQQQFTLPPARYSEATLIKTLEKYDIGRPSTYASIISTIITRKYVEKLERYLIPTDTGIVVTKLLEDNFPEIVDVGFTASFEEYLDDIANGQRGWIKTIDKFYKPFIKQIQEKEKNISRQDYTVLGDAPKNIKCPECGSKMYLKLGRYGRFHSCSKWPDCQGMLGVDGKTQGDLIKESKSKSFLSKYKPAPKTDDSRDYILKIGRFGKFWAHPDYPKVKDARPLELTAEIFRKIYGNTPKSENGKKMILRRGKFGEFWAHPDYPKVKEVMRIKKKEIEEKKKNFGIE